MMDYNNMFRVFDNGGKTMDRYTVFLKDNPEGSLGLSDNPSHPQGFSQWGDFDVATVEKNNKEISFGDLPPNVQEHVLSRFELTENAGPEDVWHQIILSVIDNNFEAAKFGIKGLIENKMNELLNPQLVNEFAGGAISFKGNDVLVNGKLVGTLVNDLEDYKRGIVFIGEDGVEHDPEHLEANLQS